MIIWVQAFMWEKVSHKPKTEKKSDACAYAYVYLLFFSNKNEYLSNLQWQWI